MKGHFFLYLCRRSTKTCIRVASGEDVAYEHVHHDAARVHCGPVDRQVHRGLVGVPLRPHHDGASASPRSPKDLYRTGAPSGRWNFAKPTMQSLDRLMYEIEQISSEWVLYVIITGRLNKPFDIQIFTSDFSWKVFPSINPTINCSLCMLAVNLSQPLKHWITTVKPEFTHSSDTHSA